MLKSISLLSAAALAATVSGLLREATLAYVFGTSQYADAAATAIFLHDTVAAAFITGGFSFAVVPLLSRQRILGGDTEAVRLVAATVVWVALVSVVVALTAFYLLPPVVDLAMRGDDSHRAATMVVVLQGALPALAIITIASAIASFLPGFDRFTQPSVARLVWNVGISVGLFLASRLGAPAGIALALVTGATANLVVVARALPGREQQQLRLGHPALPGLLKLGAPSLLGIAGMNVSLGLWERYLLAGVGVGSIAAVNYAQRASYMASTVSTAVAVVVFTEITKHAAGGRMAPAGVEAIRTVSRRYLLLLIPVMAFMMVARHDIVALLFARGAFDAGSVARTSAAFGVYAATIVPVFLLALFARALFTIDRPGLAMGILAASGLISAVLDRVLVARFGELAIPAGYTAGIAIGACLSVWSVDRRVAGSLVRSVCRAIGGGVTLGAAGYLLFTLAMMSPPFRTSCPLTGIMGVWCLGGRLTVGLVAFMLAAVVVGSLVRIAEIQKTLRWLSVTLGRYVRS